jgi:hypothetical protein
MNRIFISKKLADFWNPKRQVLTELKNKFVYLEKENLGEREQLKKSPGLRKSIVNILSL